MKIFTFPALPPILSSLALIAALSTMSQPSLSAIADEPPSIVRTNVPIPDDVEMIPDIEVGRGGTQTLYADIAMPKQRPSTPIPAILIVHGGGWVGGNRKESFTLAYFLASKGYFLASIDYRLRPKSKWPAQIEDCKLAVRWLRANAARYNIDPDHIGCWGISAGGHLVACMGTMDDPKLEGDGGYPGVSSKVQAVADFCGGADLAAYAPGITNATVTPKQSEANIASITDLLGASYAQNPALWKAASPISWVKPDDPPFLIVHGDHDQYVPVSEAFEFASVLKKAGVPTDLIIVKNGEHGMFAPKGLSPARPNGDQLRDAVTAFFDKYLRK